MSTPAEIVTASILADLEAGNIPAWRKPWDAPAMMPRNVEGREYRGINVWALLLTAQLKGYGDPRWMMYNKARELGGNVKRGEKSTPVVLWKPIRRTETNDAGESIEKASMLLRFFPVFNVDQCENLTVKPLVKSDRVNDPIEAAEAIVAGMPNPPSISWTGSKAFYTPATDSVTMPPRNTFDGPAEVYATLFHELEHSTGHKDRLNRATVTDGHTFGSDGYGREELVAEFGSAILGAEAGTGPATLVNSEAYLAAWIRTIKADPRAVIVAAAQGHKAADYVLGRTPQAA